MPKVDSLVGPLALPAVAGATDATIDDPVVSGLLAYVAHWIKWGLDARLATMTAPPCRDPEDPLSVADACPDANRFDTDPSLLVESFNKPALFAWWDGRDVYQQFTTVKTVRVRGIQFLYVFDKIVDSDGPSDTSGISGQTRWAGLLNIVAALMQRAFSRYRHPTFTPPGLGIAAGADIRNALQIKAIAYEGGQPLGLAELDAETVRAAAGAAGSQRATAEGGISVVYPCLRFSMKVTEPVGLDTFLDIDAGDPSPDDTGDLFGTLRGAENDLDNPLTFLDGILPGDDGSGGP